MNTFMNRREKTVKARVTITLDIVIAITTLIITIASFALSVYQDRYNTNVEAAKTMTCSYSTSTSQIATATMEPSKGTLKYGWSQSKGSTSCKYSLAYKKTTASSYTTLRSSYTFAKNSYYYGAYTMTTTNGKTDYNIKCTKIAGSSTASKIAIDLMIA